MKKQFLPLLLSIMLVLPAVSSSAYEARHWLRDMATPDEVGSLIVSPEEWTGVPAYADREGWTAFLGDTRDEYVRRGEKALDYQWQVITAQMYLEFYRSGSRTVMENPQQANVAALADLLMAEMAEGNGRFLPAIIDGVFFFCEQTSWVLSAHLLGQRVPDPTHPIIDLKAGNIGSLLAWTWWLLHDEMDKVTPLIASRLYSELEARILVPYMENDYWWSGIGAKPTATINNWNPWCNINVLQCYLLLVTDRERLGKAVWRTMYSVDEYIDRLAGDGCCDEGSSYWAQGPARFIDYLELLSRASGGRLDIFDRPLVRDAAEYIVHSYVGNGWMVNFADAAPRALPSALLAYRCGRLTGSEAMQAFAAWLYKGGVPRNEEMLRLFRDLSLRGELAAQSADEPTPVPYKYYPETEVCYLSDGSGLFVAAKGGHNNESHNHNDIGQVSVWYKGQPLLVDAGVGTYTRQTFSSERYSIWTMVSNWHNVPEINGVQQHQGASYRASDSHFDSRRKTFTLDLAGAYPAEAAVSSWQREVALKGGKVILTDAWTLTEAKGDTRLHWLTLSEPVVTHDGMLTLSTPAGKVRMSWPADRYEVNVERQVLDDQALVHKWNADALWRITLTLRATALQGRSTVTLRVE